MLPAWAIWLVSGLSAALLGLASVNTQAYMQVATGLEQAGLLGQTGAGATPPVVPLAAAVPASGVGPVSAGEVPVALTGEKPSDEVARYAALQSSVQQAWGEQDAVMASSDQVVLYDADLKSRSVIDLVDGKLVVETLDAQMPQKTLVRLLTQALLTPDDPRKVDVLAPQPARVQTQGRPFLLGQVVDALGKPIDSVEKAERFARWALANRYSTRAGSQSQVHRIELALDANHKQVRAARFAGFIEAAAQKYGVDANLLYAITETESHFNPFAVSRSGALGLMQLIPDRAGIDAMKAAYGQKRPPSREELMTPATNVELGAAYVAMLGSRYLGGVAHGQSREYAVIAAYNGGASRALRVFGPEKGAALSVLNQLPPQLVYDALKNRHASAETRGYVQKVTEAKKRYSARV